MNIADPGILFKSTNRECSFYPPSRHKHRLCYVVIKCYGVRDEAGGGACFVFAPLILWFKCIYVGITLLSCVKLHYECIVK